MNEAKSVDDDVRILDQEPDCIAIIPTAPTLVVVGTYSLVGDSDGEANGGRKGSLQIIPFSPTKRQVDHATLGRKDFPFGIYDIHFHPQYADLLGVATSNAEVLFFRVQSSHDETGSLLSIDLIKVGSVVVEQPHEDDGRLAIITQFEFIDSGIGSVSVSTAQVGGGSIPSKVLLAATTQFGNTKLVQACVSAASVINSVVKSLEVQTLDIHKQSFDLEAWTVLSLLIPSSNSLLVLSGGDDSQLLISELVLPSLPNSNLELDSMALTRLFSDRRTHTAGVVSVCSLGSFPPQKPAMLLQSTPSTSTIVLTGSYDETIRVFLLTPPSIANPKCTFRLLHDLKLTGGVWRITLLDQYPRPVDQDAASGYDYLLLIAGHTAGAFVIRLSAFQLESDTEDGDIPEEHRWDFSFKIEKIFAEHKSLVYAVAAKRDEQQANLWHVLSASFYDKKICNWEWIDAQRLAG